MDIPILGEQVPRHGSPFLHRCSRRFLERRGWTFSGALPDIPQMVLLGAPHTSNWDVVYALAMEFTLGFKACWIGKKSLFTWPLGGILRRLGGIPVNRRYPASFLREMLKQFKENEKFLLAIAPEGTRSRVEQWKPGFYRIARAANVPIVAIRMDFATRVFGISAPFIPTGDQEEDIRAIREFYTGALGKRPQFT